MSCPDNNNFDPPQKKSDEVELCVTFIRFVIFVIVVPVLWWSGNKRKTQGEDLLKLWSTFVLHGATPMTVKISPGERLSDTSGGATVSDRHRRQSRVHDSSTTENHTRSQVHEQSVTSINNGCSDKNDRTTKDKASLVDGKMGIELVCML